MLRLWTCRQPGRVLEQVEARGTGNILGGAGRVVCISRKSGLMSATFRETLSGWESASVHGPTASAGCTKNSRGAERRKKTGLETTWWLGRRHRWADTLPRAFRYDVMKCLTDEFPARSTLSFPQKCGVVVRSLKPILKGKRSFEY